MKYMNNNLLAKSQNAVNALSRDPSKGSWILLKNNLVIDLHTGLVGILLPGPRSATGTMHGMSSVAAAPHNAKLVSRMVNYVQARRTQDTAQGDKEIDERLPRYANEEDRDLLHYLTMIPSVRESGRVLPLRFARRHTPFRDIGHLIFDIRAKMRQLIENPRSVARQVRLNFSQYSDVTKKPIPPILSMREAINAMLRRRSRLWIGESVPNGTEPDDVEKKYLPALKRHDIINAFDRPARSMRGPKGELLKEFLVSAEKTISRYVPEWGTHKIYREYGTLPESGIDIHVLPAEYQLPNMRPLRGIPANAHAFFKVSPLKDRNGISGQEWEKRFAAVRSAIFDRLFHGNRSKYGIFLQNLALRTASNVVHSANGMIPAKYDRLPKIKNPRGVPVLYDDWTLGNNFASPESSTPAIEYGDSHPFTPRSSRRSNGTSIQDYQIGVPESRPDLFDVLAHTLQRVQLDSAPPALRTAVRHQHRENYPEHNVDPNTRQGWTNYRLRERGELPPLPSIDSLPESVRNLPKGAWKNPVFKSGYVDLFYLTRNAKQKANPFPFAMWPLEKSQNRQPHSGLAAQKMYRKYPEADMEPGKMYGIFYSTRIDDDPPAIELDSPEKLAEFQAHPKKAQIVGFFGKTGLLEFRGFMKRQYHAVSVAPATQGLRAGLVTREIREPDKNLHIAGLAGGSDFSGNFGDERIDNPEVQRNLFNALHRAGIKTITSNPISESRAKLFARITDKFHNESGGLV